MVSSKNFLSTPCCQRATFLSSLWGCRVSSCRVTRRNQARTTRRLRAGTGRAEDDARSGATCPCEAARTRGGQREDLRGWEGDLGSKRCCPPLPPQMTTWRSSNASKPSACCCSHRRPPLQALLLRCTSSRPVRPFRRTSDCSSVDDVAAKTKPQQWQARSRPLRERRILSSSERRCGLNGQDAKC